jgi:copper transport protein
VSVRRALTPLLLATVALAVLAGWLAAPREASAHAILLRADPAVNGELQSSPDIVTGFFSESLDQRLSSMEVVDGTGERVDNGQITFGPEPERMAIGIDETLDPGFYTVIWETLSSIDGHLLKGSFPFTVLNPDGTQPSGPRFTAASAGGQPEPLNVSVKWTLLVFASLLTGSLAFVAFVSDPASSGAPEPARGETTSAARRRALRAAWIAAAALALVAAAELVVQADQLGGFQYVDEALDTRWGERWIQRQLVLLGIGGLLLMVPSFHTLGRQAMAGAALWGSLAAGAGYLLLIALVSHEAAVPGSFWAVGGDFLHLLAAAVWIGMLVQLALFLLWLRRQPPETREELMTPHLEIFSVIAATSVIVLLATGTINALVQIPGFDALLHTAYGRALLVKLGVVAAVLIVAAANALYLRERAMDEPDSGEYGGRIHRWLRRAVWAEAALGIVVMFTAAILFQYPTSRQSEDAAQAAEEAASTQAVVGYEETQPAGDLLINLTISPNAPGNNSFRVFLFPQGGGEIGDVLRVRLRFQPPSRDLAPSEIEMEPAELTAYAAVGPFITTEGNWTVGVDVRRAGLEDLRADFPVPISLSGTGTQFDQPLAAGGWLTVGAIGLIVAALLVGVWSPRLPELPAPAPRLLRIGTAAFTVIGIGFLAISVLPDTSAERTAGPESIAAGRVLYTANCQQCHGPDGRGDGPLAEGLDVPPADFRVHIPFHQDSFFFNVIRNGLGSIMPGFGSQLTEDETWNLIHFLQSEFGIDAQ